MTHTITNNQQHVAVLLDNTVKLAPKGQTIPGLLSSVVLNEEQFRDAGVQDFLKRGRILEIHPAKPESKPAPVVPVVQAKKAKPAPVAAPVMTEPEKMHTVAPTKEELVEEKKEQVNKNTPPETLKK